MVGDTELPIKSPLANTSVQVLGVVALVGLLSGNMQRVFTHLNDKVAFRETRRRYRHAIVVLPNSLNVVRRIAFFDVLDGLRVFKKLRHAIEADRRTVEGTEVKIRHCFVLSFLTAMICRLYIYGHHTVIVQYGMCFYFKILFIKMTVSLLNIAALMVPLVRDPKRVE